MLFVLVFLTNILLEFKCKDNLILFMKRLQLEFDDDDITFKIISYASVFFKRAKKDFAKAMLAENAQLLLKKTPEIREVINAVTKDSKNTQLPKGTKNDQ